MKVLIDGVLHNRCPMCAEDMPENRLICDRDRKQIFDEMDKLKASFSGHYEFDMTVQEWLTKEEVGKDIHKPTD